MIRKKIVISGGAGQFSRAFYESADRKNFTIHPVKKQTMDVSKVSQIESILDEIKPDYFVHAGALTRPMIKHENNPELSIESNIIGTANVVVSCMRRNIKLVYLSTDHVYPGTTGNYSEDDPVYPINSYAWSKLGGECSVRLYENSCILRLAMVQNPFPHESAIVDSYKSSITIDDAAKIVFDFLDKKGTYNIGGPRMSIYEFAQQTAPRVKTIRLSEIKNVKMPSDVSMNTSKMREVIDRDKSL